MGMVRKPKAEVAEVDEDDPIKWFEENRRQRKETQENHMNFYEQMKEDLKNEIKLIEGEDIADRELKKRRDWIQDYREEFNGKYPDGLDKYYDKINPKKDKKESDEASKPKKKEKNKKVNKKGKGKKGKSGDEEGKEKMMKIGPSEVVKKFSNFYDEYNHDWSNRDERLNKEQNCDAIMIRKEIMP